MKFQFVLMEEIPYKQFHLIFSEELARLKCVKKKKKLFIEHEFSWYLLNGRNARLWPLEIIKVPFLPSKTLSSSEETKRYNNEISTSVKLGVTLWELPGRVHDLA